MNLTEMRQLVRKDLHDEDPADYRWTDAVLDRHIAHAVKDFSWALPLEQTVEIATTPGSRQVSLSGTAGRIAVEAVEYPVDRFPVCWQRFSLWKDNLTLLGEEIPDGSLCRIYYLMPQTMDESGSTLPPLLEELVAAGAAGYAALEQGIYSTNRTNNGGTAVPGDWREWGREKLEYFRSALRKRSRYNRVIARELYAPFFPPVSRSSDHGA